MLLPWLAFLVLLFSLIDLSSVPYSIQNFLMMAHLALDSDRLAVRGIRGGPIVRWMRKTRSYL